MKFVLVCIYFAVIFAKSKASTSTIAPNSGAQRTLLVDELQRAAKKFAELSGLKTEFEKDKYESFLTLTGSLVERLKEHTLNGVSEQQEKMYREVVKQLDETVKGLSTPELRAKAKQFQETVNTSLKKLGEQFVDLSKSSVASSVPPQDQEKLAEVFENLVWSFRQINVVLIGATKALKEAQERNLNVIEGVYNEMRNN